MFNRRKFEVKQPEMEEVDVWQCQECNGWQRKSYTFDESPNCPLCSSEMKEEMRLVSKIEAI